MTVMNDILGFASNASTSSSRGLISCFAVENSRVLLRLSLFYLFISQRDKVIHGVRNLLKFLLSLRLSWTNINYETLESTFLLTMSLCRIKRLVFGHKGRTSRGPKYE